MSAVGQITALGAPRHWPVIRHNWHCRTHGVVNIIREDFIELQMVERRFDHTCRFDRGHDELSQRLYRALTLRPTQGHILVHCSSAESEELADYRRSLRSMQSGLFRASPRSAVD